MERYEFKEVMPGFYSIEMGFVRSFMFIGTDEIMLIDLGVGGNNLIEQIKEIRDLPIKVVFTHADGDHVGDAHLFESRYMHPAEFDYYMFRRDNPVPMKPIWEGDVLKIGSYALEVILIPGHTPGSIALLERSKRFLLGGDSIQKGPIFMFNEGRNFHALIASMDKLARFQPHFDTIYACHHDLRQPASMIQKVNQGAKLMLEGNVKGIPQERFENKVKLYDAGVVSFYAK